MTESLESIDAVTRSDGPAMPEGFRAMMRGFPTGVAVVTTTDPDGRPWGMTCSSVCSVTLEPPTLLVCLRAASPTLAALRRRGAFAVNLLHDDAQATAELFASGTPDRFERVEWYADPDHESPHLAADAHAVADCRVDRTLPVGDHVVVFGEVLGITRRRGRWPLLYGLRRYMRWPRT
ncbi:flavin reductase family protein [Embleya sp. MST-111070]|uniref:flavin reductase family protein n=1 Tax=Embleya sp. MST-111070 TaxID=3398231 RepID=UPI003F73BC11